MILNNSSKPRLGDYRVITRFAVMPVDVLLGVPAKHCRSLKIILEKYLVVQRYSRTTIDGINLYIDWVDVANHYYEYNTNEDLLQKELIDHYRSR